MATTGTLLSWCRITVSPLASRNCRYGTCSGAGACAERDVVTATTSVMTAVRNMASIVARTAAFLITAAEPTEVAEVTDLTRRNGATEDEQSWFVGSIRRWAAGPSGRDRDRVKQGFTS